MGPRLASDSYGKSRVRLVRVQRSADRHDFVDLNVDLRLEGDFDSAHLDGDNSRIVPTDTMKNTVYAFAQKYGVENIESFAHRLAEYFVTEKDHVHRATITIRQKLWQRWVNPDDSVVHPWAFVGAGSEARTVEVVFDGSDSSYIAGIDDLLVLKTTGSGFSGYPKDQYTTLPETDDRILATSITAQWKYERMPLDVDGAWNSVRTTIINVFAGHDSKSVQQTAYAIGEAVLEAVPQIESIDFTLPNKHCLPVDVRPFGMDNTNEVFVPVDEPHGTICVTVSRD